MSVDSVRIKSRLRRLRTRKGVSAAEFARVAGVSESTIRRYDDPSDPREPSLFVVARICAHYGISIDWLVFGSSSGLEESARFSTLCGNLASNIPEQSQAGFVEFVQGVYDAALRMGRDGAPLVDPAD